MILEMQSHGDNAFVTLTYDDQHLRLNDDLEPTLCKRDLQLFFKRLRKRIGPFRYYACGEYGENTQRPHYHAILFGVSPLLEPTILKEWKNGFIFVGSVARESMQYVAGYVTKKLGDATDRNVAREFSVMSLRPALGVQALSQLRDEFERYGVIKHNDDGTISFPTSLVIGKSRYPLGRTILDKLCHLFGGELDKRPYLMEMYSRFVHSDHSDVFLPDSTLVGSLAKDLFKESEQRNIQIKKRFKIFNHRNKI